MRKGKYSQATDNPDKESIDEYRQQFTNMVKKYMEIDTEAKTKTVTIYD